MIAKDYRDNPNLVKLVGLKQLDEINKRADAISALPCPFCGSDPEVRLTYSFGEFVSIYIACNSCGIRTPRLMEGQTFTGNNYTLQDRLNEAVTIWNRRV